MFWLLLAILVVIGALATMAQRRRYGSAEDEPWRASLDQESEPLDWEQARRAEEEFLNSNGWETGDDEEPWRE